MSRSKINSATRDERADRYALDFITRHTKFEIDGKVYRALVQAFKAFEEEINDQKTEKCERSNNAKS